MKRLGKLNGIPVVQSNDKNIITRHQIDADNLNGSSGSNDIANTQLYFIRGGITDTAYTNYLYYTNLLYANFTDNKIISADEYIELVVTLPDDGDFLYTKAFAIPLTSYGLVCMSTATLGQDEDVIEDWVEKGYLSAVNEVLNIRNYNTLLKLSSSQLFQETFKDIIQDCISSAKDFFNVDISPIQAGVCVILGYTPSNRTYVFDTETVYSIDVSNSNFRSFLSVPA